MISDAAPVTVGLLPGVLAALSLLAGCRVPTRELDWIRVEGADFVGARSGERFVAWGFNYDHDREGRLLEDYWDEQWPVVEEDLAEMKDLGANVVRIHLQLGRFMESPERPNRGALERLRRLLEAAERIGLYLDVTGLGCCHAADVPAWYDVLSESERWAVQARFWGAVAEACKDSPAVFCYDLMNEPILPGAEPESEWLAGEFAGKHFVQRISLDLAGRTRAEVARAWVETLVAAIRGHDERHLITVGVIPWALTFPGARPLFYAPDVRAGLDFASVHVYPERGRVTAALDALALYDVGLPLVIEETFPLRCGIDELDRFIQGSRPLADGWIGFYWGETPAELSTRPNDLAATVTARWLEFLRTEGREIPRGQ